MPFYIATGRDSMGESSVKVFAQTDELALLMAREKLIDVCDMERISPDGSTTKVTGVAYDHPKAAARKDHNEEHFRMGQKSFDLGRMRKWILLGVLLLGGCSVFRCAVIGLRSSQPQPVNEQK